MPLVSASRAHRGTQSTMTPSIRHHSARRRAIAAAALAVAAGLAISVTHRPTTSDAGAGRADRTSYAVGLSAGRDFGRVAGFAPEFLRQGLLDGLGAEASEQRIMSRPERFTHIREMMKRLSDAELAAVAARIERDQEF
jgi:hypothetical protein